MSMRGAAAPSARGVSVLSVNNLAKSYGAGPKVLTDVSFAVRPSELLGIIGPNGSGKTTLFGTISGQLTPDDGTILLDGKDVTRMTCARRAQKGIGRSFQVPQSFSGMTVFENLLVGARFAARLSGREAERHVLDVMAKTGFSHLSGTLARDLPLLDRKRLELARALATRPRLLLLDEIAGGLTDDEARDIAQMVGQLSGEGIAVIWIEHLVHILTTTVGRLIVLGEGRIIADGEPATTMKIPAVRQIYLGMEPDVDALCS
jgi:branched-chain amino acid transport system ATP-binding protein